MGRQFRASVAALFLGSALAGTSSAQDTARAELGDTEFVAGGDVVLDEPVGGNAFAAGGRVELRERVYESAYLSGGDVTIAGPVDRNLYAAGGNVRLESEIGGRARLAGGTVRMSRDARIERDATFAGGTLVIDGEVGGRLRAYGERIEIHGRIDGDVETAGESIWIGPEARIGGRVSWRGHDDVRIDPAAEIGGGVVERRSDRDWAERLGRGATIVGGVAISVGMLLLGVLLILGMPRFTREAGATLRHKPWQSLGLGIVVLVAVPVVMVVLTVTLVGIPLALLLVFGYLAMLLLGFLTGAIFVGDLALGRIDATKMASAWWRALFFLLALVVIALVKQLPVVGSLAWWLLFLAGLGAFAIRAWNGFRDGGGTPAQATR